MSEIIFLYIFSYLFGSIPNGYLITKLTSGKDIRKIGKKKLSSSNIMKNVGYLPGILSACIDILKGTIAVYCAQVLGFSAQIQATAAILALSGQMWPVFMKFWGGRGGATCIGAFLILSSKITLISLAVWVIFKLALKKIGAAIGMFVFLILAGILGAYYNQEGVILFSVIATILVLIQRVLGEPGSLGKIKDKKIILFRFFLDRDTKEDAD